MLRDLLMNLEDPGKKYRGIPFWSWNDKLEENELRWQIRQMDEAGIGGYFMHARAGLKTPYMGEEWMDCIEACIEEGSSFGMGSWFYDENGYPSGFAGGAVPAMGVEYRQKSLRFEVMKGSELSVRPTTLGVYKTGGSFERVDPHHVSGEEELLHVYYEVNRYYTDLLDEKAVRKFIEITYDVYYERFGKYFGKEMPGIFTDEPQYGRHAIPWSFAIPKKFREKYGYDIEEFLSALYYKIPGYRKIRYDFWKLLAELFTLGFAKQVGEWCESHGCKLTGHVLLEEDICYQVMCSGSAMGFYRHMQIPGIDWLGRTPGNPVIGKQVSSVAEQLGKKQVLSEMFACSGWNASFENLKQIAEWQFALGVNVICSHLEGYSLRGLRKRDHPPGMFYQAPWWKDYRKFNDYFARLGMLLTEGEDTTELLVIHPLRSGWTAFDQSCYNGRPNPELEELDRNFALLSEILSGLHFDYHYGDEDVISDCGCIRDGKFVVSRCSYSAVILPPSTTLDLATVRMLQQFMEQGGTVYAFDEFPYLVNGEPSDELRALKNCCTLMTMERGDILGRLSGSFCKDVAVLDENETEIGEILHKTRRYGDEHVLFIVNTDSRKEFDAAVKVGWDGALHMLDLESCKLIEIPAVQQNEFQIVKLKFAPAQSYVIIALKESSGTGNRIPRKVNTCEKVVLKDNWQVRFSGLNVLTLDYCKVRTADGLWSDRKPVAIVQRELLELGRDVDVELEFQVRSMFDFEPGREIFLVIEDAEKYLIEINGKGVKTRAAGWWKDKSFRKVDIEGTLAKGDNSIILKTRFCNSPETAEKLRRAKEFEAEANMLSFDSEIENIYLLGDFIVQAESGFVPAERDALIQNGQFYLDKPETFEYKSDFTCCGYPFYAGSVALEQQVEIKGIGGYCRILFKMDKPYAALSRLSINGSDVKAFLWAPYETDILPYLKEGTNLITLEITGTDRNLFGPHHHPNGELFHLGPMHFTDFEGWLDSYCLVKFGLRGNPALLFYRK